MREMEADGDFKRGMTQLEGPPRRIRGAFSGGREKMGWAGPGGPVLCPGDGACLVAQCYALCWPCSLSSRSVFLVIFEAIFWCFSFNILDEFRSDFLGILVLVHFLSDVWLNPMHGVLVF
jgi:hypothetical protein